MPIETLQTIAPVETETPKESGYTKYTSFVANSDKRISGEITRLEKNKMDTGNKIQIKYRIWLWKKHMEILAQQ